MDVMRVCIDLPIRDPDAFVRRVTGLLEETIALNMQIMRERPVPYLYSTDVIYRPEPPGPEEFANVLQCLGLAPRVSRLPGRWGDCDDLMCWRVAELRTFGEHATPRIVWRARLKGSKHAQVRRGDGSIDDPCMWAIRREAHRTGRPVELT